MLDYYSANMKDKEFDIQGFNTPAVYQIKVKGELGEKWSGHLGDMQITYARKVKGKVVTQLTGMISDQTSLAGILKALYDMHYTILSVNVLEEK